MKIKYKRAAIITWCLTSLNYGELLQAYSMQMMLKRIGITAIVISYSDEAARKSSGNFIRSWSDMLGYTTFRRFTKRNMESVIQCRTKEEVEKAISGCDLLFCGSDQIWNPNEQGDNDIYTLHLGSEKKMRIAYAVSMGVGNIWRKNHNRFCAMTEKIRKIDYVSVRETTAKKLLESYIDNPVEVVLDPTMMMPEGYWEQLVGGSKCKKNYMFVYLLGNPEYYQNMIQEVSKRYSVNEIIYLDIMQNIRHSPQVKEARIRVVRCVPPEDFLSYIFYSDIVFTDSFHGTVFAILFHKFFYAVPRKYGFHQKEPDGRIEDLLYRMALSAQWVSAKKDLQRTAIDYQFTKQRLETERKKSWGFLMHALYEENRRAK